MDIDNSLIKAILIEDDLQMCEILKEYLLNYNIELTYYRLPIEGLNQLKVESFDVIILDINLPQIDGLEVCKRVKSQYITPVIIISARSAISDRVLGLELGADDYLPKPFDPRELVARIRVAIRNKTQNKIKEQINNRVFEVNNNTMEIYKNGEKLNLTKGEFEVLNLFITKPNFVMSRDFIVDNVEALKWESIGKSVDIIIGRIRSKIGDDPKNPKHIKSIRGVGYRFCYE